MHDRCSSTFIAAAALTLTAPTAQAETQTQTQTEKVVAEVRTYLYFDAADEAAASRLPEGWASAPIAQGPAAGADAILVLIDRLLATDVEDQPLGQGTNQLAVVVLPSTNAAGEPNLVIAGGYSADAASTPGFYGNYEPATVEIERTSHTADLARTSEERWSVRSQDGDALTVSLAYAEATPAASSFDQTAVSAADPSKTRHYQGTQVVDVLRSVPAGVDRVSSFELTAEGGPVADLMTADNVVAISRFAHYGRNTFVP